MVLFIKMFKTRSSVHHIITSVAGMGFRLLVGSFSPWILKLVFCCVWYSVVLRGGLCPVNVMHLYDPLIRPFFWQDKCWQVLVVGEAGVENARGYNFKGHKSNPLAIWQCDQNALAMLNGADPQSPIGQLRNSINASDDGVRGHLTASADFKIVASAGVGVRRRLGWGFEITSYLPVYSMKLGNIVWSDHTLDRTSQDIRVKTLLTDNFVENVRQLSGMNIGSSWHRTGFGDWTSFIEWNRLFPQYRALVHYVIVNSRVGLVIPTGLRQDYDRLFAVPFGTNGAIGIPFGGGLDIALGDLVTVGLDVQLAVYCGISKVRPVKTDPAQTDLLFIQKAHTYIDIGMDQRFELYAQINSHGCIAKLGYQYLKHGDDYLSLKCCDAHGQVANTAIQLFDWTMHHLFATLSYNPKCVGMWKTVRPHFTLFSRVPFNGKRSVLQPTIGFSIGADF
jgi:hypothetical protein